MVRPSEAAAVDSSPAAFAPGVPACSSSGPPLPFRRARSSPSGRGFGRQAPQHTARAQGARAHPAAAPHPAQTPRDGSGHAEPFSACYSKTGRRRSARSPTGALVEPIKGALWRGVTFKGFPHARNNFCKLLPATKCTVTGGAESSLSVVFLIFATFSQLYIYFSQLSGNLQTQSLGRAFPSICSNSPFFLTLHQLSVTFP